MSANNALVIGGSGGIAQALIQQLVASETYDRVYVVSRAASVPTALAEDAKTLTWITLDSLDTEALETQISAWCDEDTAFSLIINTIGLLHSDTVKPEKRLEDIDIANLTRYFEVNTMTHAQWLKQAHKIVHSGGATYVAFSARVGSISDNHLGGWYGYRASKAALNMLMKTASVEYARRSKNTRLVCYHPGTVDTGLSKPFQSNVKPSKLFTPDFTASQLLSILPSLGTDPNIHYIDWQGEEIHW
ncbi:SDR family NAD(P)-dependent oxidoreductase [Alteromonas oceanisediminis]|uniref:SDR family NAD(P)-dependent oxidoreductase n=1 Tax=Alteromonas oceanisediminis TaxID=2836180 RepID=UPI001BD970A4|nr:SDR family NAD(P)-dependent oxidoreductase [Alteromonas oceanisediminis]MBT0585877.1 SDR family NAD(P)-dependent oxidoreductase [Alteromonas oceanisediminis]